MTRGWYEQGPGPGIVRRGFDFRYFQAGSDGYHSIVRGDDVLRGRFDLLRIDLDERRFVMRGTTVFPWSLEQGAFGPG